MHDRRIHQRFKLDDTCVINHDKKVGTVIDISAGGLSCICLDQGECSKGFSTQVKIYCRKQNLCAEDIKMNVLDTEKVPGQFMKDVGLRKCRAKFCQVDDTQLEQLATIIVKSSLP